MSYRETKYSVETQLVGNPGCWVEWAITARVYLCDPNDRNDSHAVDEWLTATRVRNRLHPESFCSQCGQSQGQNECGFSHCKDHAVPSSMDADEFFALAKDVDKQKVEDAVVQEAIDCYEPTDRELSDFYGGRNAVRDHVPGVRVLT